MLSQGKYLAKVILLATTLALVFFMVGYNYLKIGQPHEDAYILYKYSENIAQGHGIVYYQGGEHAEGATDFLWLLLLAFLNWLGVDIAIASLLANSLGAFIAAAIFVRAVPAEHLTLRKLWLYGSVLALFILTHQPATAAYEGFSSMLYSAVTLLIYAAFLSTSPKFFALIPILSIILGLIRPDGVIIGVAFTVLGFLYSKERDVVVRYVTLTALAAVLGGAYFVWRYAYFGNLLPLPLYVKSHGGGFLPGLLANASWAKHNVILLVGLGLVFLLRPRLPNNLRLAVLGFVPVGLLIVSLSFAVQEQNIDFRFQAPFTLMALFVVFQGLARIPLRSAKGIALLVVAVAAVPWSSLEKVVHTTLGAPVRRPTYMDLYPIRASHYVTPGTRIALTEAGRMAYWVDAEIVDLVGLNTGYTAKHIPTLEYISQFDPDIMMLHVGPVLDTAPFANRTDEDVLEVRADEILGHIYPINAKFMFDDSVTYEDTGLTNITVAPLKALGYLARNPGKYRIFLVRYDGGLKHLYAFKTAFPPSEKLIQLLYDSSKTEQYPSYLTLKYGTSR